MGHTDMTLRPIIRYLCMAAHFCFIPLMTFVAFYYFGTWAIVPIALSLIPLVIYIPAAFILGIKRSEKKFDRAYGEIGYLSVQIAIWLATGIYTVIVAGPAACAQELYTYGQLSGPNTSSTSSRPNDAVVDFSCTIPTVVIALSFLHVGGLGIWAIWIIRLVRRTGRREVWGYSTARIVRGEFRGLERVDLYQESRGVEEGEEGVVPFRRGGAGGEGGLRRGLSGKEQVEGSSGREVEREVLREEDMVGGVHIAPPAYAERIRESQIRGVALEEEVPGEAGRRGSRDWKEEIVRQLDAQEVEAARRARQGERD